MERLDLWEKAAAFHGHICGGLTIGFKASLYAAELLGLSFTQGQDEEVVCIAETDACGVDAIQSLLGCSVGKGNLLFHLTGKQAFSFYVREDGRSVRLLLRPTPAGMSKEESFHYLQDHKPEELFDAMPTRLPLPERARIFDSYVCECCGELTAANWIRIQNGKKLCLDCAVQYDRFHV